MSHRHQVALLLPIFLDAWSCAPPDPLGPPRPAALCAPERRDTPVADPSEGGPRIAPFQNTPAAFHGRPHLASALTAEFTAVARTGQVVVAG